jgi:hypothetical protein
LLVYYLHNAFSRVFKRALAGLDEESVTTRNSGGRRPLALEEGGVAAAAAVLQFASDCFVMQ